MVIDKKVIAEIQTKLSAMQPEEVIARCELALAALRDLPKNNPSQGRRTLLELRGKG